MGYPADDDWRAAFRRAERRAGWPGVFTWAIRFILAGLFVWAATPR